jgi:hypothetical protein
LGASRKTADLEHQEVEFLRRLNRAVVSEPAAAVIKYCLVASLCCLLAVALLDARQGRFGPGPAAFAAARR